MEQIETLGTLWVVAAQALAERNPASHAIRFIGLGSLLLIVGIIAIEAIDAIKDRIANRRARIEEPEQSPGGFGFRKPETELRDRYGEELPRATTREQRGNEHNRPET